MSDEKCKDASAEKHYVLFGPERLAEMCREKDAECEKLKAQVAELTRSYSLLVEEHNGQQDRADKLEARFADEQEQHRLAREEIRRLREAAERVYALMDDVRHENRAPKAWVLEWTPTASAAFADLAAALAAPAQAPEHVPEGWMPALTESTGPNTGDVRRVVPPVAQASAAAPSEPDPPPVCTGTGTGPVDFSPTGSFIPHDGRCGICGQRAPIQDGPEGVLAAHPYRPAADEPASIAATARRQVEILKELHTEPRLVAIAEEVAQKLAADEPAPSGEVWPCGHKKLHPEDELCRVCPPSGEEKE
jgi:hypothetical protein